MKLRLIIPLAQQSILGGDLYFRLPSLGPLKVAAATPSGWEIRIIDEKVETIDFSEPVDLVGISVLTPVAPRAYRIADEYRRRGVTVVMGGMHPSKLPEEALAHCDAVVIGEAEGLWQRLLEDFQQGRLQRIYRHAGYPSLDNLPLPDWDLYRDKRYLPVHFVETTRGCPYDCEFCAVTNSYGARFRNRPLDEVERELQSLKPFPGRFKIHNAVFFVDDLINSNPRYAKELFRRIRPYNLRWLGQATTLIARDREMLELMAKSGCMGLLIGFETLSAESLSSVGKGFNRPQQYQEIINRIHDAGIGIDGAFVFGFDHDDPGVFERTLEFVIKAKLDICYFSILTPYPGTALYRKLRAENRIIDEDWSHYNSCSVVFRPKQMSPEALLEGYHLVLKEFHSISSIVRRLWGSRTQLSFFGPMNYGFRQTVKKTIAHGTAGMRPSIAPQTV